MINELILDYQNLHKIPEEGFKEFKTKEYILDKLKLLNCKIYELSPTGIIAYFDNNAKECIGFRCELDGLNILEENNFDFKSTHLGFMHACGHDGHMSILLSLAKYLSENKCNKNVCCIFQPSEEKYGGALSVVNNPIFKDLKIKEVYALHLTPNLKEGVIASRPGVCMANSTEIDIEIIGEPTHMINKDKGIDAIEIANEFLNKVEKVDDTIFNCGKLISRGSRNVVCSDVVLECSLRTFSIYKRYHFLEMLHRISKELSNKYNANIYLQTDKNIPAVKNDLVMFEKCRHLIDEVIDPTYLAEDFSFYQEKSKGLYMFLGIGETPMLHSNKFNFNPICLEKGYKTFVEILGIN